MSSKKATTPQDSHAYHALSPLDGRYASTGAQLRNYFSEYALMRYRIEVEIKYLIALIELPLPELKDFPQAGKKKLQSIAKNFSEEGMARIKEIEKTTRHDIKSVEYYIKEQMDEQGLAAYKEFVHIGLTSQDINNTAIPMALRDAYKKVLRPELTNLITQLKKKAEAWEDIAMLAHTHGQPATPTLLGKEIQVFVVRLEEQLKVLNNVPFSAKFGGATGGMNAHYLTYPDKDWHRFANKFVKGLGLKRSYPSTQIEHYDHLAAFFDAWGRIATILIDYARDMWQYISLNYFRLQQKADEIGSSTMPHKVNPIDFENAEGNLGLARAIGRHFSEKLPISRLQRDLSDSTVLRNMGVPLGHLLLALQNLQQGTAKVQPNIACIDEDLLKNLEVISEGLQILGRRKRIKDPYELIKMFFDKLRKTQAQEQRTASLKEEYLRHFKGMVKEEPRLRGLETLITEHWGKLFKMNGSAANNGSASGKKKPQKTKKPSSSGSS